MEIFKKILSYVFNFSMIINVIALAPQPIKIFLEKKSSGVSVLMFVIFLLIQLIVAMHGKFNLKSNSMFWGMLGSALLSAITIILTFVY